MPLRALARFLCAWAAVLALLLTVSPVLALDPETAAGNMARRAAQAYESGDYENAARLYFEAFRTWNTAPDYLFGAARAEHLAGQMDAAREHYQAFIDHAQAKPERVGKARGYLQELTLARALQRSRDADVAQRQGNHKYALQLLLEAVSLAPERGDLPLRAAQAALLAHDPAKAAELARHVLASATATPEQKRDAQALVSEAAPGPAPAAAAPPAKITTPPPAVPQAPAATPPAVTASNLPAPPAPSRTLATVALAGGLALDAAAVSLWLWAASDRASLNTKVATKDAQGLITGVSREEATAQVAGIEQKKTVAAIVGGVGLIGTAAGAWLWWAGPSAVVATPVPGGLVIAGRF